MKNYMKFEEQRVNEVKRGFKTVHDAMEACAGYICCMRDMEVLSVDRVGEEVMSMIARLLVLEQQIMK